MTGQFCNHSGHQEMGIILHWCFIRSVQSNPTWGALELIPLLCKDACQSSDQGCPSSLFPHSSLAATNLCHQRFANVSAQRHTFMLLVPLSFPASQDSTSLKFISVFLVITLLLRQWRRQTSMSLVSHFQNRISYCLIWVFWKIVYFLCYRYCMIQIKEWKIRREDDFVEWGKEKEEYFVFLKYNFNSSRGPSYL